MDRNQLTGLLQDVSQITEALREAVENGEFWDNDVHNIGVLIEGLCLDLIAECSGFLNTEPNSDDVSYADPMREHRHTVTEMV